MCYQDYPSDASSRTAEVQIEHLVTGTVPNVEERLQSDESSCILSKALVWAASICVYERANRRLASPLLPLDNMLLWVANLFL